MPRAFDRLTPQADFDPTNVLEFDPLKALKQSGELWQVILNGIAEFAENLVKEFIQRLLNIALDPGQALEDLWDQLTGWVGELPTPAQILSLIVETLENAAINAANLVGKLSSSLFSLVPIGAVANVSPNLLPAPIFATGSITDGTAWNLDPDKSRTADGSAALHVVADGGRKVITSGDNPSDFIAVAEGQKFVGSVYVSHNGYVGSGAAVLLQLVPFTKDGPQPAVNLASYIPSSDTSDWQELTGSWEVTEGIVGVQERLVVTEGATAGDFYFDDASASQTSSLRQEWINGLPEALQQQIARWQLIIDTVTNTLSGGVNTVLNTVEDMVEALRHISPENIAGILGPENIAALVRTFLDSIVGGLVGTPGEGASLADVFNISKIVSSWASLGRYAMDILNIRNNSEVDNGFLPSGYANISYAAINTTVEATPTASLISVRRVRVSQPSGVISWRGYRGAGMTALYVIVRKIDPTTGDRTLVHHSANIIGITATTEAAWTFYEHDPFPTVAGEDYEVEWVPVGGSYFIRGIDSADDIDDHPFAQVLSLGATRNSSASPASPPATIAKASVVASSKVPWFEMAINTGIDPSNHDPQLSTLDVPGDYSIPRPPWATAIDYIIVPAGGGGSVGGTAGFYGRPGKAGPWVAGTLLMGTDFEEDDEEVSVHVGIGGEGGHLGDSANDGEDSSVSIGTFSVTAPGGTAGSGLVFAVRPVALGPGNFEYNGEPYAGGVDQRVPGGDGAAPGGPGNGGNALTLQPGGDGAEARVWLVFRVDDGAVVTPPDTTPPTAPTSITVDAATFSTLTVTASGATDD